MTSEARTTAPRVVLHVGVPKSGTSFLQATLRENADRLREAGVHIPTQQHHGLFHAALELTGTHPSWGVPPGRVEGSWAELCQEARDFPGTTVLSSELFSNIADSDVPAALAELDGVEVHLVVTARDLARQLPAEWQEGVKHGRGLRFDVFLQRILDPERSHDHAQKFWRHQDVAELLARWGSTLPPEHVHLVTVPPPGAPRDLLWQRFCSVVELDPGLAELPEAGANTSLGITAIDVLRRVNQQLPTGPGAPALLRRTVKQTLVNGALRDDRSPRVSTPAALLPRLAEITHDWDRQVQAAGYDVVGDLADLDPHPADGAPPDHRVPTRDARDLAVKAVAVLAVEAAQLRGRAREVKHLRQRVAELEAELAAAESPLRRALDRLRDREPHPGA